MKAVLGLWHVNLILAVATIEAKVSGTAMTEEPPVTAIVPIHLNLGRAAVIHHRHSFFGRTPWPSRCIFLPTAQVVAKSNRMAILRRIL